MPRNMILTLFALTLVLLGGCTSLTTYTLTGRAVVGDYGEVVFVEPDDSQLNDDPIGHVQITVYRDAGEPNQSLVASGRSDGRGYFEIQMSAFGAGWMIEKWSIEVHKQGYQTIEQFVTLPGVRSEKRMLIVMTPGASTPPRPRNDLWEEYEQYR